MFYLQEHDTFVGSGNFYFSFLLYFPWWLSSKPFRGRDSISGFCVHCALCVKSDVSLEWRETVRTSLCARQNFAPLKSQMNCFLATILQHLLAFAFFFFHFQSHALFFPWIVMSPVFCSVPFMALWCPLGTVPQRATQVWYFHPV